ncbi:MAG TPA: hypothetical protein VLC93_18325, partial [Myxococcota bacterium]|nr:hypothetical protein [Myxococcota bacterium]
NGTPTRPFRTIGGAVSVALAYAERVGVTPTVRVASRAAGYDEAVEIVGGPLDLLGGWASDFATRDPVGNATRVSATSTALRAIGVTQPVTVDGFDWVASAANLVRAVDLIQVSDTLTLRNCTATADAQPNGSAVALGITGVSGLGPRLEDLTLTASDAPAALGTTGLDIKTGCARATNLTIVAGGSPTSTGVRIAGPSPCDIVISDTSAVTNPSTDRSIAILVNDQNIPSVGVLRLNNVFARAGAADVALGVSVVSNAVAVIDASTAIAGAGVDESYALSTGSEGRVVARDSVFRSLGATTGTSMGVYLRSYASTLVGNTLAAGDATGGSFALYLDDSNYERHVVRNNIFATHSATGICVRENYRSEIASFESNAMLVCSTLYNLPVTATSLTTTTAVNALDNTPSRTDGCPPSGDCHHRRVNGTAAGASAWTTYFVDPNGANGDPNDDFRLLSTAATATLRSGGKDPAGTDCGVHEVAEPCNGTAFDRVGTQRDAPFSIGAFETP